MNYPVLMTIIPSVVGGLGIFMLGMKYMSDGLQATAGNRLRRMISVVTNNRFMAVGMGTLVTCIVQSSSVTTVMCVGFVNSGFMTLHQAIGVTLGANIGTTVTAILAALATQNPVAVTVAFAHLCFNIFGILIFYPLKFIPIRLALFVGEKATVSNRSMILFVVVYLLLYLVPLAFIILT